MSINFRNITYLSQGSASQQKLHSALMETTILDILKDFDPIVIGTYPLDIQVADSDVDIVCCFKEPSTFKAKVISHFSKEKDFTIYETNAFQPTTIVANFKMHGYEFELFGQKIKTEKQMGYLHMVMEYSILQKFNTDFRKKIISLKESGIKTEPAFCQLLNIEGDPYIELLNYRI